MWIYNRFDVNLTFLLWLMFYWYWNLKIVILICFAVLVISLIWSLYFKGPVDMANFCRAFIWLYYFHLRTHIICCFQMSQYVRTSNHGSWTSEHLFNALDAIKKRICEFIRLQSIVAFQEKYKGTFGQYIGFWKWKKTVSTCTQNSVYGIPLNEYIHLTRLLFLIMFFY